MIVVRWAWPADAIAIAAVHVAVWRSTYPHTAGHIPGKSVGVASGGLLRCGDPRLHRRIRRRCVGPGPAARIRARGGHSGGPRIIGFDKGRARPSGDIGGRRLGEGEIETLYVLDDWRERGIGRRLMRTSAGTPGRNRLPGSVFLWVLRTTRAAGSISGWAVSRRPRAAIQFAGRSGGCETAFCLGPDRTIARCLPQES